MDNFAEEYLLSDEVCSNKPAVRLKDIGGKEYEIRIDRELSGSWVEEINTIKDAGEQDEIRFVINSPGGCLNIIIEFLSAVSNCKCAVTGELVGNADSAASMLLLACDNVIINSFTRMLIHTACFGIDGNIPTIKAESDFSHEQAERMFHIIYKDFLSEDEIRDVLDGRTIILDDEQIIDRWTNRADIMFEKIEKETPEILSCSNCGCEDFYFSQTLSKGTECLCKKCNQVFGD